MGDIRLTGRLGSGDREGVYLGQAPSGRPVTVRVLPAPAGRPAAEAVESPWTARVLAVGAEDGVHHVVSEHVPGPTLAEAVERDGPRTGAALHRLAAATIAGLADLHRAGLVYRDFRPEAVVLGPDGPRIVDVAAGGLVPVMDPAYKAPEQLTGGEATSATDVFAWAATMAFASSGRPPFGRVGDPAVVTRVLREQADLGALAGRLHEIALRCLAKDPRDRPSAADVLRWLRQSEQPMPPALPRRPSAHRQPAPMTPMTPVASPVAAPVPPPAAPRP
ncbi:MAG TPA: protein kinase, partial [Thermomonospora sp.]|nr:protein kinase [Thermomonospora sp.]